jgi:hypothetical protein
MAKSEALFVLVEMPSKLTVHAAFAVFRLLRLTEANDPVVALELIAASALLAAVVAE